MRASYGGRVVLLVVLVAAGFVGLALQGARSSADDGSGPAASVTRPEVDALLKGAEPVASLGTDTSKTYRRRDGSFVTRVFAQSSDADPTLTPTDGGGWTADGHDGTEHFPATLADPIKVTRGSAWVSMSLTGGAGTGTAKGSTVTYADALPGVAVSYRASNGAVGEDLHLTTVDAPSSYTFDVAASDGVHPVTQRNGTIALLDSDDQTIFSLSPSYAFADSHPTDTQKVTSALAATSSGWRVTLSLDGVWLRGALADGPVTIDPTVELQGATKDCALTSDTPTLSYCSDHGLWVGWSGDHDHHSVIKWDVSAIPQDALILAGDAGVYQSHSMVTVDKTLALHRVTRDWTNGASWNTYDGTHAWTTPGGDYDPSPVATQVDPAWNDGWVDWYPTGLVQHWVDGSLPNYGVLVKDDGTHTTGEEDFGATEAGDPVTAPELDIVWTTRGGTPDASTFENRSVDATTSAEVNVANGNLVLSTQDLAIAGQNGLDLDFSHYYNSIADPTVIDGVGLQTTGSLGRDVHLAHLYGSDIAFSRGDGLTVAFTNPHTIGTTKTFDTPYELAGATLTQNTSTNDYTLDLPSGLPAWGGMHQVLSFDQSGALTKVTDEGGDQLAFSYYPSGYTNPPSLGGITDSVGAYYDVDRSSDGEESVDNIADPTDAYHWTFAYDSSYGTLTRATAIDNTNYQYAYDSSHRLTRVTTPTGAVWLITYNGTTRQVASIVQTTNTAHTTGPTTTYTYSSPTSPCSAANFDYKKTIVQRPDSSTTTYCSNDHAQITYDTDNPSAATPSGEWFDLAGVYTQGVGTHSITVAGADAGSGVKILTLERANGSAVASTTLPCDPRNAQNPTACPHTTTQTTTFDPRAVPEGRQSFDVKTTDYAGRAVTSAPWAVTIDRTAPPSPTDVSLAIYDGSEHEATLAWDEVVDPALPDGSPGSGADHVDVRYGVNGGPVGPWQAADPYDGVDVSNVSIGDQLQVEARAVDKAGNASAVTAPQTITVANVADEDGGVGFYYDDDPATAGGSSNQALGPPVDTHLCNVTGTSSQGDLASRGNLAFQNTTFGARADLDCGGNADIWKYFYYKVCVQVEVGGVWKNYKFRGDGQCASDIVRAPKNIHTSIHIDHLCYPGVHDIRVSTRFLTKSSRSGKIFGALSSGSVKEQRVCNNSGAWRWLATNDSSPGTTLGDALIDDNQKPPGDPKRTGRRGFDAHHIVPATMTTRDAPSVQALAYSCENIDPNAQLNGVWLRGYTLSGPNDPDGKDPRYDDLPPDGRARAYHPTIHTPAYMSFVAGSLDSAVAQNYNCDEDEATNQMSRLKGLLKRNQVPFGGPGSPLSDGDD